MKKAKRIVWIAAAFLLFLIALGGLRRVMRIAMRPPTKIQATAPSWWNTSLPDTSGVSRSLAHYRGKPLVIHFWASWCSACLAETPSLLKAYRAYAPKGIQFIGIAIDSARHTTEFVQQNHIPYPMYIAGFAGTGLSRKLGNIQGGLPFIVMLDATGRIRHTMLGKLEFSEFRRQLNAL